MKKLLLVLLAFTATLIMNAEEVSRQEVNDTVRSYWDTGLPVVIIDTHGKEVPPPTGEWLPNTIIQIYEGRDSLVYESTTLAFRGRGNATWYGYPKKAYALKLEKKNEILGMASSKRWCLLANYKDRTLMRNDIAFKLGNTTDLAWSPHGRFVELILNGNHIGNYYLSEQVRVERNRVDINEVSDYLLEIDSYYNDPYRFRSNITGYYYNIKSPKEPDVNFIWGKIEEIETLLFNHGDYASYIDFDSFIDYWFITELTGLLELRMSTDENCNIPKDGNMGPHSVFYQYVIGTRGEHDKLKIGPIWDFDWSTFQKFFLPSCYYCIEGLPHTEEGHELTDFYMPDKTIVADTPFYRVLFSNPEFRQRVKQKWETTRIKFGQVMNDIENNYDLLRKSDELNHILWPIKCSKNSPDGCMSFREAVNLLKEVFELRLNYMDQYINDL